MGGNEIERMLKMIDANVLSTQHSINAEILRYIAGHQSDVAGDLLRNGQVSIPTSVGSIVISRSSLDGVTV